MNVPTGIPPGTWARDVNEYARRYYALRRKPYCKEYARNVHTRSAGYVGVCVCPRCGCKGYAELRRQVNDKTGVQHRSLVLFVQHHHTEHVNGVKKTVYDRGCYICSL